MAIQHIGHHSRHVSEERAELGLVTVVWIISAISAAVLICEALVI